MFRVLLVIVGIAALAFGVFRAATGMRGPLGRGAYQAAVQTCASSLLVAVAGFTVLLYGFAGTLLSVVAGLLIGIVLAGIGGAILYNTMVRQVGGNRG